MTWMAYRLKYGPLNPIRMYDQGPALIASQVNNAHGGKARPIDFIPYGKQDVEKDLTEEEFIAALGPGVRIGR